MFRSIFIDCNRPEIVGGIEWVYLQNREKGSSQKVDCEPFAITLKMMDESETEMKHDHSIQNC
jgi:hypothetical protein